MADCVCYFSSSVVTFSAFFVGWYVWFGGFV